MTSIIVDMMIQRKNENENKCFYNCSIFQKATQPLLVRKNDNSLFYYILFYSDNIIVFLLYIIKSDWNKIEEWTSKYWYIK
jgi:hypothetical protein